MAIYNAAQLQQILRQAGWSEGPLVNMAAIALAESGGNSQAHNAKPPDDSYGLWQINMLGRLGPERRAALGINSNSALYNPVTNARAALMVYGQQGYRAWSVYLNGSYRKFLPQSQAAYNAMAQALPTYTPISPAQTPVNLNPVIPFPRLVNVDGLDFGSALASTTGLSATTGTLLLTGAAILGLYLILR